jgi:hypothetical protein
LIHCFLPADIKNNPLKSEGKDDFFHLLDSM